MDTELGFPDIPDGYLYFSEEEDGCLFPKGEASGDSQGLFDFSGFLNTPSPAGSPLIHPKRKQPAGTAAGASVDASADAMDNFEDLMSELMKSDASSNSAVAPFVFSDQDASNEDFASLLPPPPPPPSPRQTEHIDLSKCFSAGRIDSALLAQAMRKCTFNKEALDKACVNMVEVCNALVARA